MWHLFSAAGGGGCNIFVKILIIAYTVISNWRKHVTLTHWQKCTGHIFALGVLYKHAFDVCFVLSSTV